MKKLIKDFCYRILFKKRTSRIERINGAFIGSIIIAIFSLIILYVYALSISCNDDKTCALSSVFSVVTLIAFASFSVGGISGFLFGIPRTLQHSNGSGDGSTNQSETNTNLEQISDWLTKIMVGVGLTQIGKITAKFNDLCFNLGSALEPHIDTRHFAPVAGVIMILFMINGFIIVYLWTRLFLAKIQDQSFDDKMNKRDEADKQAISIANNQLNLPKGVNDMDTLELYNVFKNASGTVISNIYFRAVNVRKLNWSEAKDKMERTIPIFRALIKLDERLEFPENYAELGYALKDKSAPDYKEALSNLSNAIDGFKKSGNTQGIAIVFYNRAVCRINTDENFLQGKPSSDENYNLIRSDIDEAGKEEYVSQIMSDDNTIKTWLALNKK